MIFYNVENSTPLRHIYPIRSFLFCKDKLEKDLAPTSSPKPHNIFQMHLRKLSKNARPYTISNKVNTKDTFNQKILFLKNSDSIKILENKISYTELTPKIRKYSTN